jgi:uncharacterized protein (DUF3820 family)
LKKARKPVVTTLHTVMREPPPGYCDSLAQVATLSDHLVVLNGRAIPILKDVYGIPEEKISFIHHGVPDVTFLDPSFYKDKFGVEGRTVILTFGLLSRNKGIEVMLDAFPEVVRAHAEVVYIVLGATHPEVKRRDGEEYRLYLQSRVRALGLEDHVVFHDQFVELEELLEFIGACDIYVSPYKSKEQIVSGTLAYAVGAGKAVISTPYSYAEELLADGRGRLFPFDDAATLADTLLELIGQPSTRNRMRKLAYQQGRQMIWPEVARHYIEVFERVVARPKTPAPPPIPNPSSVRFIPEKIKLDHLIRLTDDTGLMQHAAYGVPDRRFGYSSDDAGRGLVVTLMHFFEYGDKRALELAAKYLSFLQQAQTPDGKFRNLMSYDRQFLDQSGSEDTQGRAMWGLGAAVALAPDEGMRALSREMFERGLEALDLHHPRAIAYAICGLSSYLRRYETATAARRKLSAMGNELAGCFGRSGDESWRWFDEEMTYANSKMPHAMLLAYHATGVERFKQVGLESLDFLLGATYRDGYFDFIGNRGWFRRGGERATFAQQPIEAGYTAEACLAAYEITGLQRYLEMGEAAAEWLLGRNQLCAKLYDLGSGACADGLEATGPSMNQGGESAVCALLALLVIKAVPAGLFEADMAAAPVEEAVATGSGIVSGELITIRG